MLLPLRLADQCFLSRTIEERCGALGIEEAFVRRGRQVALLQAGYGNSASDSIKAHINLMKLPNQSNFEAMQENNSSHVG